MYCALQGAQNGHSYLINVEEIIKVLSEEGCFYVLSVCAQWLLCVVSVGSQVASLMPSQFTLVLLLFFKQETY